MCGNPNEERYKVADDGPNKNDEVSVGGAGVQFRADLCQKEGGQEHPHADLGNGF